MPSSDEEFTTRSGNTIRMLIKGVGSNTPCPANDARLITADTCFWNCSIPGSIHTYLLTLLQANGKNMHELDTLIDPCQSFILIYIVCLCIGNVFCSVFVSVSDASYVIIDIEYVKWNGWG
jgi:hypothetical protein